MTPNPFRSIRRQRRAIGYFLTLYVGGWIAFAAWAVYVVVAT